MSYYLNQLEGRERQQVCEANDRALATGAPILDTTRRYPRTVDEAFRTPRYATPFEHHLKPPMLKRIRLAWRRSILRDWLAAAWRWC